MPRSSDRNLLFGILSLQMDFISQQTLIEGMQAWLLDKSRPLGELLVERGALTPENRSLLEPLVDAHIRQHDGDAQHSLAALSSDGGVVASLVNVDDSDLQASLSLLPQPEPFRSLDVGFRSSVAAPDDEYGPATHGEVPVLADGHVDAQPVSPVGDGSSPEDSAAGDPPDAKFQETLIPGTLDQFDEPKLRFRILRPHAEGGLGRVHVALDQELNREVAFKEIKFEHARRKDAQARFVVEAEVTGGLEHPGIVPVYGLGHFPDGRPFYAMRFIRGQSLHDAVREFHNAAPTTPENLRYNSNRAFRDLINRLIDVCNAIGYAHSRKVLHRDLKPGNIMLGRYGETLVVDWGLAKAQGAAEPLERSADGDLPIVPASGSQSAPTMAGSAIGTPAYMSPEQAEGKLDLLGPSCDIYSLGATLYEILTGRAPLKGLKIADILKRVGTGDIPLPRTINPHAPLALQAVCRKAMALQPQDRYATANALADDLDAWLADEPVSAWPEPLVVRARRWAKRNQTLVTATAASVLMAAVTLSVMFIVVTGQNEQLAQLNDDLDSSNQQLGEKNTELTASIDRETSARQLAQQNEQRAIAGEELAKQNEARAVAGETLAKTNADAATEQSRLALSTLKSVIFNLQRSLQNVAGGAAVRRQLLSTVLPQLEQVSTEFSDKSAVDRNTMAALTELADVVLQLGQSSPHAPREEPNTPDADESTSDHPAEDATATRTAERLYRRAHAISRQLLEANPDDPRAQRDLSVLFIKLGDLATSQGNLPEAARLFGESLDIARRLAESDPANAQWQCNLGISNERLGNVASAQGDLAKAHTHYSAKRNVMQRLAESDPGNAAWQRDLSVSLNKLGQLATSQGNLPEAARLFGESLDIRQRLAESDPGNAAWQFDLGISNERLGDLAQARGDLDEARRFQMTRYEIIKRLAESDPGNAEWQRDLSVSLIRLGVLATSQGNLPEAARLSGESLDIARRLAESDPGNAEWQRDLAQSHCWVGNVHLAQGNSELARQSYENYREMMQRLAESDPGNAEWQRDLSYNCTIIGQLLMKQERWSDALPLLEQSLAIDERLAAMAPTNVMFQKDVAVSRRLVAEARRRADENEP